MSDLAATTGHICITQLTKEKSKDLDSSRAQNLSVLRQASQRM